MKCKVLILLIVLALLFAGCSSLENETTAPENNTPPASGSNSDTPDTTTPVETPTPDADGIIHNPDGSITLPEIPLDTEGTTMRPVDPTEPTEPSDVTEPVATQPPAETTPGNQPSDTLPEIPLDDTDDIPVIVLPEDTFE